MIFVSSKFNPRLSRAPFFRSLAVVGLVLLLTSLARGQGLRFTFDATGNLVAQLAENSGPPQILGQPQRQVVGPGELASFSVVVADSRELSYQWRFNGTNLAGAIGDTLLLTKVGLTNQGQYAVVVANSSGSVTSAPAALMLDSRGSGMPDSWQLTHFGNLNQTADGDFDGDGVSNLDEFLEGTDPADPASYHPRLRLLTTTYGQVFASPGGLAFYTLGQVVTLTAVPDDSSSFLSWSGSATGTKDEISLVMNGHKTVTASFGKPMPPPVFQAVDRINGAVGLTWSSVPGRAYQLQFKTNLDQIFWQDWGAPVTASDWTVTSNHATGADALRFFRVGLLP